MNAADDHTDVTTADLPPIGMLFYIIGGLWVISLLVSAATVIAMAFEGADPQLIETGLGGGLAGVAYFGMALAALFVRRRGTLPRLMLAAASLAMLAMSFVMWLLYLNRIDARYDSIEDAASAIFITSLFAVALLQTGLLFNQKTTTVGLKIVRWCIVGLTSLVVLLFTAVFLMVVLDIEPLAIVAAPAYLLAFVSLIASGLFPTLTRQHEKDRTRKHESIDRQIHLVMTCPKCGEEASFTPGFTRCRHCRLALTIEVEEPRCECGYLLFNLTGDVCPECGKPLPPEALGSVV